MVLDLNNMAKTNDELQKDIRALERRVSNLLTNPVILGVLKLPIFTAVPTKGSIGDVVVVGTKLYICTAANTFTVVGTQS